MPMYSYKCDLCGHKDKNVFQCMSEEAEQKCPRCRCLAWHRVPTAPHVPKDFRVPIEMHSIGMTSADEITDFQRKCPDIEVQNGTPIAKNRAQKLQALKAAGFVEAN